MTGYPLFLYQYLLFPSPSRNPLSNNSTKSLPSLRSVISSTPTPSNTSSNRSPFVRVFIYSVILPLKGYPLHVLLSAVYPPTGHSLTTCFVCLFIGVCVYRVMFVPQGECRGCTGLKSCLDFIFQFPFMAKKLVFCLEIRKMGVYLCR